MSLLLDALKRAELANEQQADENEAMLSDPIQPSDDVFEDVPVEAESPLELAMEPLPVRSTQAQDGSDPGQFIALEVESQPLPNMSFISESVPQTAVSQTAATNDSMANERAVVPGENAATAQALVDGLSPKQVETESSATPDISAQTAPVKLHASTAQAPAQAASIPYQPKSKQTNAWFIGASLLLLIIIGASGAYYFVSTLDQLGQDSNVNQVLATTTVIEDIAQQADAANHVTAKNVRANNVTVETVNDVMAENSDNMTSTVTSARNKTDKKQITRSLSSSNKGAKAGHVAPSKSLDSTTVDRTSVDRTSKPTKSESKSKNRRVLTSPREKIKVDAAAQKEPITIVRKMQVDPVQVLLQKAYASYVNGNYTDAKQSYQQVLGLKPKNRDALLGLAVISHRSKQPMLARRYYRQVLSLNPKDSQATAGLISLAQGNNAIESESRLKLLLEQEPQAAYLHFALGNQYVSQARWADAQEAFFQAYHADPNNAEYAMNLAISLDHIKQPQAALQYYRLALELARGKNVGFNVLDVARRIKSIMRDFAQ